MLLGGLSRLLPSSSEINGEQLGITTEIGESVGGGRASFQGSQSTLLALFCGLKTPDWPGTQEGQPKSGLSKELRWTRTNQAGLSMILGPNGPICSEQRPKRIFRLHIGYISMQNHEAEVKVKPAVFSNRCCLEQFNQVSRMFGWL